jgi:hypothetical protein
MSTSGVLYHLHMETDTRVGTIHMTSKFPVLCDYLREFGQRIEMVVYIVNLYLFFLQVHRETEFYTKY